VCPFGATCYRKNLLHFAEFSHPFNLLNPDADSSDEEEELLQTTDGKRKRKAESEEYDDGEKTEEYNSDHVSFVIDIEVFNRKYFYYRKVRMMLNLRKLFLK
jgi:hypothetical protein